MKKFAYILTLLLGFCLITNAQSPFMNSRKTPLMKLNGEPEGFGYADKNVEEVDGVGTRKAAILGAYIQVTNINGATLNFIDAQLADAATDDNGAIIILDNSKKVVYTEQKTIQTGYNHLALSTPYKFTTDGVYYIGYIVHSTDAKSHPIGFDAKNTYEEGNYMSITTTVPKVDDVLTNDNFFNTASENFGTLMVFLGITDAPALDNMGLLTKVDGNVNVKPNETATLLAFVRNIGLKEITSTEVTYKMNGTTNTVNFDTNIAPDKLGAVPVTIQMPAEGSGTIEFSLTKINGKDNATAAYSITKKYTILVEGGPFPRKTVLIEHFTTEKCPNCPAAEPVFENYIKSFKDAGYEVSTVEHHSGYYTDAFTVKGSTEILPYIYGSDGTFAPAAAVNRLTLGSAGECAFFPAITSGDLINMLGETFEYGTIDDIVQTIDNGNITVKVTGSLAKGFNEDLYLTAIVTEDNLKAVSQAGASGEFIHHDVARLFLSESLGSKATVTDGKFELTFPTKSFNSNWKQNDMKVVVFGHRVLNTTTKTNYAQHEVLFSRSVPFDTATGINDATVATKAVVASHDGMIHVGGQYNSIGIYDMGGSLVATSTNTRLVPGVYIVKLNTESGRQATKIVVR